MKRTKFYFLNLVGFLLVTAGCSKSLDFGLTPDELGTSGETTAGETSGGETSGGSDTGGSGRITFDPGEQISRFPFEDPQKIREGIHFAFRRSVSTISIEEIGRYQTNIFADSDKPATEISVFDKSTNRVFVNNAHDKTIMVLSLDEDGQLKHVEDMEAPGCASKPHSVSVFDGILAASFEAEDKVSPGCVAFYKTNNLQLLSTVTVGAYPDMLTFTPDGSKVLTANEGEPLSYDGDPDHDPEGSISIIDMSKGAENLTDDDVKTVTFHSYNSKKDELNAQGVRIFGPDASVSQDLEPEYITISADSKTAWVSLQENNTLAVVNINSGKVTDIFPLGFKDHSKEENSLDVNDKDEKANILPWPVYGMYQPDTISSYEVDGVTYVVTANEGDPRNYDGFEEEVRVKDLKGTTVDGVTSLGLSDDFFDKDMEDSGADGKLGRLNVSKEMGFNNDTRYYEKLYSFGGRSFSIWNGSTGKQVFDSGDDFEQITYETYGDDHFNEDNIENETDNRSSKRGPEPEALAVASIGDKFFAFIGLERESGIMVYDVTNPEESAFVQYVNNRNFSVEPGTFSSTSNEDAGDLGPECIIFLSKEESPSHYPLLIVTNEVSGTLSVYRVHVTYESRSQK